jgi:hypothetical protein
MVVINYYAVLRIISLDKMSLQFVTREHYG